jgi:hypothetical protein
VALSNDRTDLQIIHHCSAKSRRFARFYKLILTDHLERRKVEAKLRFNPSP